MKNLLYMLSIILILTSCSKKAASPDSEEQYKRATTELKQVIHVLGAGEKTMINVYINFPENSQGKASEIIGYDVFSENTQIYTAQGISLRSEDTTHNGFIYGFQSNALKEGWNTFDYNLNYADGHKQKASGRFYALKDKKIGTWWDKVSYTYLDTVAVTIPFIHRINVPSEMKPQTINAYFIKPPQLMLIEGLCGEYYVVFDTEKRLQTIYVSHGYDYQLNAGVIKDDLLKVYPDCSVTESPDKASYILKNADFTFRVYSDGSSFFTEVKKNK